MSEEQVQQAVRDIEVIRASGVGCEFGEAEYVDEEYVSGHLELVFPGTRPVDLEAVYRLIKHSETPLGLDVLKKAFGRAAG